MSFFVICLVIAMTLKYLDTGIEKKSVEWKWTYQFYHFNWHLQRSFNYSYRELTISKDLSSYTVTPRYTWNITKVGIKYQAIYLIQCNSKRNMFFFWFMVFNATFNNSSVILWHLTEHAFNVMQNDKSHKWRCVCSGLFTVHFCFSVIVHVYICK